MDDPAIRQGGTGEAFATVVIPVFADSERLLRCLHALADQTLPPNRFEVLVVDNGSSPPVHLENAAENVKILREEHPGSYAARNTGARLARGAILAFTDSDCIPDPGWLASALETFDRDPSCHAIAGDVEVYPHDANDPTRVELYDMVFAFPQQHYAESLGFAVTANLFVRRDAFMRIGPFDPTLPSGGDVEWGRRALGAGVRIRYVREVKVAHPARSTWKQLREKGRRVAYGEYQLLKNRRASRAAYWVRWLTPPIRKAFRGITRLRGPVFTRLSVAAMSIGLHYLHLHDIARWHLRSVLIRADDTATPPVR